LVPTPNALWHIDGNHKLIRWLVFHCCVDGFQRQVRAFEFQEKPRQVGQQISGQRCLSDGLQGLLTPLQGLRFLAGRAGPRGGNSGAR